MERNQFTFYKSFKKMLQSMGDKQRLALFDAITDYGIYGEVLAPMSAKNAGIFDVLKPTLDCSARKAQNAMKAAAKRKQNGSKKESENEIENELEIETETETENDCSKGVCEESFAMFWELYPVKLDREGAQTAWAQIGAEGETVQKILENLKLWKASPRWRNEGGRYIPNPGAFLTKGYWRNTPASAESGGGPQYDLQPSGILGEAEKENIRKILQES